MGSRQPLFQAGFTDAAVVREVAVAEPTLGDGDATSRPYEGGELADRGELVVEVVNDGAGVDQVDRATMLQHGAERLRVDVSVQRDEMVTWSPCSPLGHGEQLGGSVDDDHRARGPDGAEQRRGHAAGAGADLHRHVAIAHAQPVDDRLVAADFEIVRRRQQRLLRRPVDVIVGVAVLVRVGVTAVLGHGVRHPTSVPAMARAN